MIGKRDGSSPSRAVRIRASKTSGGLGWAFFLARLQGARNVLSRAGGACPRESAKHQTVLLWKVTALIRTPAVIPHCLSVVALSAALSAQGALPDYRPTAREVVLNTDFTQATPATGLPYNVTGGVFVFRNVHIPAGVHVRGTGSKPMIWVVTGSFRVDGELSVDGEDGQRVDTLNSGGYATRGGAGACTGGRGGKGSPSTSAHSTAGEYGFGPGNSAFLGGGGGLLGAPPLVTGSGGGGGVFATAGDPHYRAADGLSFTQRLGDGGSSWRVSTLAGGVPGTSIFVDGQSNNDFFGTGFDLNRRVVIAGELKQLIGGQGGGGGGDFSYLSGSFTHDSRGGGGGGAGGVIVVLARGKIIVGSQGQIRANGGNGGGGEQAGSNNKGAGGGGGSGGMVVIASLSKVELHAHGETFANQDYSFCLSAEGGIGTQGIFSGWAIEGKYPPVNSYSWSKPSGGFGGLGIIQILTPIGSNVDGTNTIFDDNIDIVKNGQVLQGSAKQRYIAWRGYPDANGVPADDSGKPTNIGRNAGDMRPTPILQPMF